MFLLPWLAWVVFARPQWNQHPLSGWYGDYGIQWSALRSTAGVTMVVQNLIWLVSAAPLIGLEGLLRILHPGAFFFLSIVLGIVVWCGVVRSAAKGRVLGMVLAAYGAVAVIWPWPSGRFVVPILPLLLALGAAELDRWMKIPLVRAASAWFVVVALGFSL